MVHHRRLPPPICPLLPPSSPGSTEFVIFSVVPAAYLSGLVRYIPKCQCHLGRLVGISLQIPPNTNIDSRHSPHDRSARLKVVGDKKKGLTELG